MGRIRRSSSKNFLPEISVVSGRVLGRCHGGRGIGSGGGETPVRGKSRDRIDEGIQELTGVGGLPRGCYTIRGFIQVTKGQGFGDEQEKSHGREERTTLGRLRWVDFRKRRIGMRC